MGVVFSFVDDHIGASQALPNLNLGIAASPLYVKSMG
jgi:hypothetical protein